MKNFTVFLIFSLLLIWGKEGEVQKKIFRQDGFDIECYVYIKELKKYHTEKKYYWYRSREVHQSIGQAGGDLLHQQFKKYSRNNHLVEEGSFEYGLKTGIWKEWYPSGNLKRVVSYKDGFKNGHEVVFNTNGERISKGRYSKNRKIGRWVNFALGDTLYYKKDSIYNSKPTTKVGRFIRGLFQKRDSIEKAKKRIEKIQKKRFDSLEKALKKEKRIQERSLRKKKNK